MTGRGKVIYPALESWQRRDQIASYDLAMKLTHYRRRIVRALRHRAEQLAAGHIVKITAAADRGVPKIYNPGPGEAQPAGTIHAREMHEMHREIAGRVGRSKRRIAIMCALATGHAPWGVDMRLGRSDHAELSLCGREYILCCGHVLRKKEAQLFVDSGLIMPGPLDIFGRPALVITAAGVVWLQMNW